MSMRADNHHHTRTHMYQRNEKAWELYSEGLVDLITATNQSACGFWRDVVTKDASKVTCKKCLKVMNVSESGG